MLIASRSPLVAYVRRAQLEADGEDGAEQSTQLKLVARRYLGPRRISPTDKIFIKKLVEFPNENSFIHDFRF